MEVGLSPGDCVRWGPSPPPSPKRWAGRQIFGPSLLWPNGCIDKDATWYRGRPQPARHYVRWGPSSPPLKGHSPQFSVYVRCGQTAGWTKMPLNMEVGLGPGDFVFDGDPAISRQRAHPPHPSFGPCLLWPNGLMDEDATCYGSRLLPTPHCIKRCPISLRKGHISPPPLFGP